MKRFHLALGLGCGGVSAEREVKGIFWERVTTDQQVEEIRQTWPSTSYHRSNPVRSVFTPPRTLRSSNPLRVPCARFKL